MNIEETLKSYIARQLAAGKQPDLGIDTNLLGLVDSIGFSELTVWIEDTFGFSVDIEDLTSENFGSVRSIGAWVRRNTRLGA